MDPTSRETTEEDVTALAIDIRHLSARQLAALGMAEIAYVKPVVVNGAVAFAIHAADGSPMGIAAEEKVALAAIRQHGLEPALVQ